ncbi:MAG TPA: hypothetical protein EYP36_01100 [Calditrichaeota bacterium]|nr:hypothetical protein [Calditrichota bacterium]
MQNAKGGLKLETNRIMDELKTVNESANLQVQVERSSSEFKTVQRIFVYLQILSAAFAHGANGVANAVGPLAAVVSILRTGLVTM